MAERRRIAILRRQNPWITNIHELKKKQISDFKKKRLIERKKSIWHNLHEHGVEITLEWKKTLYKGKWVRWHAQQISLLKVPCYIRNVPTYIQKGDIITVYIPAIFLKNFHTKLRIHPVLRILEMNAVRNWKLFMKQNTLIKITSAT